MGWESPPRGSRGQMMIKIVYLCEHFKEQAQILFFFKKAEKLEDMKTAEI